MVFRSSRSIKFGEESWNGLALTGVFGKWLVGGVFGGVFGGVGVFTFPSLAGN